MIVGFISPTGSEMKLSPAGGVCEDCSMYVARYPIPNAASPIAALEGFTYQLYTPINCTAL